MGELNRLEDKANALYKCHNYQATAYKISSDVFSLSVIAVSIIITTFLPMLKDTDTTLVNSLLGFYITLVTTITKSYKISEKYEKHRKASQEYISLKARIRQKIIQSSGDDQRNIPIINEVIQEFERLRKEVPFISNDLYDKKCKENNHIEMVQITEV